MEEHSTTYFFLFRNIHEVLKAESALKKEGALFELVPVPRALSSDCGVCISLDSLSNTAALLISSLNVSRIFVCKSGQYEQVESNTLHAPEDHDTGN